MSKVLRKGDKGSAVLAMKAMLVSVNKQQIDVDENFGEVTEQAVKTFQQAHQLVADGIVGKNTIEALTEAFKDIFETPQVIAAPVSSAGLPHKWVRVECDKYGGGFPAMSLRDDVAERYNQVREIIKAYGAIMTSAGGRRALGEKVTTGRSGTSFHYTGRAFDFGTDSGMNDPNKDPYVVQRVCEAGGRVRYIIWARCNPENATLPLPDKRSIPDAVTYFSRVNPVYVKPDYFINLTAVLNDAGFKGIFAKAAFEQGGSMMNAEWWHFQYEGGLVVGQSNFGKELLKVYTPQELEGSLPWQHRNAVFGVDWK